MQSKVIVGAINVILDDAQPYSVAMSKAEKQKLRQKNVWIHSDRMIATRALEAIMFSTIEILGFKRFELPSEFVAAVIGTCVRKANWMQACHLMSDFVGSEAAVMAGFEDARQKCTPDRLFSMVMLCEAEFDQVDNAIDAMLDKAELDTDEAERQGKVSAVK